MTFNELKALLKPAGGLLLLYFLAPLILETILGSHDAIYGGLAFSSLLQVGLGIGVAYKLFGLKGPLKAELGVGLQKYGQPLEKVYALAEKISLEIVLLLTVAVIWPPVGEMVRSGRLMLMLELAVLGAAGWLGYDIWRLAKPFLAYVPPQEPVAEEDAAFLKPGARRCPKCGQTMPEGAGVCAFCRHRAGAGK